jgi:thioredoxin reductase (NADPH)
MHDAIAVAAGPAGLLAPGTLRAFGLGGPDRFRANSRRASRTTSYDHPGFGDGIAGVPVFGMLQAQGCRFPAGRIGAFAERAELGGDDFGLPACAGARGKATAGRHRADRHSSGQPHVRERLEEGVLRCCPVCDAYEVIDDAAACMPLATPASEGAFCLRHISADIPLLTTRGWRALTHGPTRPAGRSGRSPEREARTQGGGARAAPLDGTRLIAR